MSGLTNIIINIPIALIAIIGHELAHAWVSTKLGDPTPRYEGRLTLNPLAHLDPIGTLLMIFTGFGWARPVGVNPMYYKDRKKGMALVAIAGPLSNFAMAFVGILLAVLLSVFAGGIVGFGTVSSIFVKFAFMNLRLMAFNLIPIPPLDGSKILGMLLPNRIYYNVLQYERYAMILILLLSVTGVFSVLIDGGVNVAIRLIIQLVELIMMPFKSFI
jgi:Zn-dependent protease